MGTRMEINKTIAKYSYRIEAKPGGGFVAHPTESSMETLEAATKEEILQKVEQKIGALIGKEFPGIDKLLHTDPNVYRIEAKPDGGFVAHPPSSSMQPVEGRTKEEILQKIEDQMAAVVGTEFPKGETVTHKDLNIGGLHVTIDKKVKFTTLTSLPGSEAQPATSQSASPQPSFPQTRFSSSSLPQDSNAMGPILPAKDTSRLVWQVIGALVALGALLYFFLRR